MQNPWTLDTDEVPDDAGVRQSSGGMKIIGAILWGSLFALVGMLVVTDAVTQNLKELLPLGVTIVASVALTVALGWLAYFIIRRLSLVGGALFGIGLLLFLVIALPFIWQLLAEQTDLFSGLFESVSLREPVADVLPRETGLGSVIDSTNQQGGE